MQRHYGLSRRRKRLLRSAVFALLRFSGLPFILREIVQCNKITILVYHAMPAPVAERHFRALSARYNIISLSAYLAWKKNMPALSLPPKSIIITFDDGHKANYELKPLLEKHRVPVTIFLCSGIVGTQAHYWWSHVKNPAEARALKAVPDEQRAQVMLERGHFDTKEYETREALSWDEITEMKSLVDFQSHGVFHPILPACSGERARSEVFESKKTLEQRCGLKICALAYPNGDYSDREISLLRSADYTCGLTLDPGFNDSATDSFCLRRIPLPDDAGISELIVKASGLWSSLQSLWRLLGLRHDAEGGRMDRKPETPSARCG